MFWLETFFSVIGSRSKFLCIEEVPNQQFEKHFKSILTMLQNDSDLQRMTYK